MDKKYSKIIKKALVATGTVFGAVAMASAIGTKIIFDQTEKKKARLEGKTTYASIFLFGKNTMVVKEDMDILFPSTILGTNTIDFTKNPIKKETYVDYMAVFGNIVLRVPQGVRIICDEFDYEKLGAAGEGATGDMAEENIPTIYVTGKSINGNLKIVHA